MSTVSHRQNARGSDPLLLRPPDAIVDAVVNLVRLGVPALAAGYVAIRHEEGTRLPVRQYPQCTFLYTSMEEMGSTSVMSFSKLIVV